MSAFNGTVLLTGAAGFIGSHTAEALLARGCRVVGLDSFDPFYDRAMKERNIEEVRAVGGDFEFIEGDITDADAVERVFAGHAPGAVIHLAALAGVRPSIEQPGRYMRVNVEGTVNILESARRHGADRMVVASSSSVYGNCLTVPFAEDAIVTEPISPYAASKVATESICHTHHALTDMPTCCLRFFTVFGPRQRPDLAINKFMRLIHAGEAIPMFGDGSTSRDYTFIEDIVAGVVASLDRVPGFGFRVWNLGGNQPVTLSDMIRLVGEAVGKEPVIDRRPIQPGDVNRTYADLSRCGSELGYAPSTSFEDGLAAQWAWLRDQL